MQTMQAMQAWQVAGGRSRPDKLVTASKIRGRFNRVWAPMRPDEPFRAPFLHFPARSLCWLLWLALGERSLGEPGRT